ncbi:hypothetical protein JG688_00018458, partial [Phytophthora aleatoria]
MMDHLNVDACQSLTFVREVLVVVKCAGYKKFLWLSSVCTRLPVRRRLKGRCIQRDVHRTAYP